MEEKEYKTFAEKVKSLRESAKLTIKEAADAAGVKEYEWQNMENGGQVGFIYLWNIANALKTNVDKLIK